MAVVVKCRSGAYREGTRKADGSPAGGRTSLPDGKESHDAGIRAGPDRHPAAPDRGAPSISGVVYAEDVSGPYDTIAFARQDPGADDLQGMLEQIRQLLG